METTVGILGNKRMLAGHLSALFTILVWGTTFISTKVLLADFRPVEILFLRFVLGFIALCLVWPHRMKLTGKGQMRYFVGAGICGVTLYFLMENIALSFTFASNVGVIVSISPFFTALFSHLFVKGGDKLRLNFFVGFLAAMVGIFLISFNGSANFQLNPAGDLMALAAAVLWAAYSVLTKKISSFGYPVIPMTRRIFAIGLIFMLPVLAPLGFHPDYQAFANPVNLFNIVFLGLGASALCFVTWNMALAALGAVRTAIYLYMVPIVTVITSVLVLHEQITGMAAAGIAFTVAGLVLSQTSQRKGAGQAEE